MTCMVPKNFKLYLLGTDTNHRRASSYPRVQFTAVLNIHNGPGEGAVPSEEYAQGIGLLNSLNNVRTIGYVATTWCTRNLSSVLDDIAAYSFWGEYNSSLAVHGIFVDETPTKYAPDYVSYLQTISQAARNSPGLKDDYIGKAISFIPVLIAFCGPTKPRIL